MTQRPTTERSLAVIWHSDFARETVQSIHWWPDRLQADAVTAAGRLRCLELRVDAAPRSNWDDGAYDEAHTRLGLAVRTLLESGVLGAATRVVVGSPAPRNRLRTYKGLFYNTPEPRVGPRYQWEIQHNPKETVLVGFEPADLADEEAELASTLIIRPEHTTREYWEGLVPDVLASYDNERGYWQDDTKLVSRLVRGDVAVMLFNYSPDTYWNACLYHEATRESAVRFAWEAAHRELFG